MNFTYTTGIPDAPNNPSNDQPIMKVNNDSNNSIWTIDHFGFNDNQGGWHNIIHQPPQVADPALVPTIGQLYTKAVSGVTELFYESSNGTVVQITSSTGVRNAPVILSGTFTPVAGFTNIVLLPANVYGYIIFFRSAVTRGVQLNPFVTTGTNACGFSSRIVVNGSSNDDPVELNNNSATLNLQGRVDDFPSQLYNWRLHYWLV